MNPIAVLITYHDEGALLRRCLASLAKQTRAVDEILIYDDASTIRPEGHVMPGLPVRIIRGERNIGPARARNVLLKETTADWVHFHDADDVFAPEWCEQVDLARRAEAGAVDAVFTEVASIEPSGMTHGDILGLARLGEGGDLVRFCIEHSMLVPAGTYRRQLVLSIGGYREALWQSEDWDFHVRLACARPRYRAILRPLVEIHLRAESRSRDLRQVWSSAVQAIRVLATELPGDYRRDLSEAAARAGSRLFRAGAAADARAAFQLALQLGEPAFAGEPGVYRVVARHAGQEWAERFGSVYRKCVPEGLRERLGQWRS